MKLTLLPILAMALFANGSLAQQGPTSPNSIYLELGGNGLIYSLNYDRLVTESMGVRAGIGYLQLNAKAGSGTDKASVTTIPIMVHYLLGSRSSKLELGAGVCIISAAADISKTGGVEESATLGTATFGYRYQRADEGMTFRAGVTPFFGSIGFQLWFGLGFGYGF